MANQLRIIVPQNLDDVFSIDNFKFSEVKSHMKYIFEILQKIGIKIEDLDFRFMNKIQQINENSQDVKEIKDQMQLFDVKIESFRKEYQEKRDSFSELINKNSLKIEEMNDHEQRISEIEEYLKEIEDQINQEQSKAKIDYTLICSKQEYLNLYEQTQSIQQYQKAQENQMASNEQKIQQVAFSMEQPVKRIKSLEEYTEILKYEIKNKVSNSELYTQLKQKAQVEKVQILEQSLIQLNEFINTLPSLYADKIENDLAHQLLQKNLKNLYDLFVAFKSDQAGGSDPLFTTKTAIQCASCAKGVLNIGGYRADNVNWGAFPFKDPAKRMLKSGMGFSKMFHQSQAAFVDKIDEDQIKNKLQNMYYNSTKNLNNPLKNTRQSSKLNDITNYSSQLEVDLQQDMQQAILDQTDEKMFSGQQRIRHISQKANNYMSGIGTKLRYQNQRNNRQSSNTRIRPQTANLKSS